MSKQNDATLQSGGVPLSGTELTQHTESAVESSGVYADAPISSQSLHQAELQTMKLLGQGGMGRVSLAFDPVLNREVAVKELLCEFADTESFRQDFIREARINGGLHHPGIVPVHALHNGRAGSLMFTMQAVNGENLGDWLESSSHPVGSPQRLEVGLEIFLKICDALAYAHSRGILHCDLKPENVMVGEYGSYYLMDWGLARPKVHEVPPGVRGTPAYMAPEQARNEPLDERADIFCLGAILLEIVSGTTPYGGGTATECQSRAVRGEVIDVPAAVKEVGVSSRVCALIQRAVAPKREDRYQTVIELRDDIRAFLLGGFHLPRRTFGAGSLIVKEGDVEDTAYMLVSGRCRVYRQINGVETTLRHIGPGDILGELSLLLDTPRTASVKAEEQCTALVIDRNAIERSGAMVGWPAALMRALAHRFREMELKQDRHERERRETEADGKSE
ncbi:MAG TPA: serine/threonine-protein kinase [Polyangiaceae bacterium]|jgi:serine/threonine-protein kinase